MTQLPLANSLGSKGPFECVLAISISKKEKKIKPDSTTYSKDNSQLSKYFTQGKTKKFLENREAYPHDFRKELLQQNTKFNFSLAVLLYY